MDSKNMQIKDTNSNTTENPNAPENNGQAESGKLPYSYHTFVYPFEFDGNLLELNDKKRGKNNKAKSCEKNVDLLILNDSEAGDTWKPEPQIEKKIDIEGYNIYNYFTAKARNIIFNTEMGSATSCHYKYNKKYNKKETELYYSISYKEKIDKETIEDKFELRIQDIKLSIFPRVNIGILTLETENYDDIDDTENADEEDNTISVKRFKRFERVCKINEFGRRLFYPSIHEPTNNEEGDKKPQSWINATDLSIEWRDESNKAIKRISSNLSDIADNCLPKKAETENCLQKAETENLEYKFLQFLEEILGGSIMEKLQGIKPIIDERMFVNCIVRDDKIGKLLQQYDEEKKEYDIFQADKSFTVKDLKENSSNLSDIAENCLQKEETENLEYKFLQFLKEILGGSIREKLQGIKPIIDERMFVNCIVRDDKIGKLLQQYDEEKKEYDIFQADKSFTVKDLEKNPIKNKSALLYSFVFVDKSHDECSCQNKTMRIDLLKEHVYGRWIDYGTIQGITEYSFVSITGEDPDLKYSVIDPFLMLYLKMAIIALVQRAALNKIEEDIVDVCKRENTDIGINTDKIAEVWENFVIFQNDLFIPEVTFQEQGAELYAYLKKAFKLETLNAQIENELDNLHEYAELIENKDMNYSLAGLALLAVVSAITDGTVWIHSLVGKISSAAGNTPVEKIFAVLAGNNCTAKEIDFRLNVILIAVILCLSWRAVKTIFCKKSCRNGGKKNKESRRNGGKKN